ncbi:MAG: substrate-binding domain-containing protein [Rubritepida sp.]|jgi:molybdate transport system substrate-binding protein|nr:substrate-binding domain-containing protein [Rubritepida sp.]
MLRPLTGGIAMLLARRHLALLGAALAAAPARAAPATVHAMTSGAFTAAYRQLVPVFERETGHRVVSAFGASMGAAPDAIPQRLARGEPADLVVLAAAGLERLAAAGLLRPGSRVDLVHSRIGLAVRAGEPTPPIGTVEELRAALLAAPSIAFSASASGVYFETELVQRLGVAAEVLPKSRRIYSERVGSVVARGDAALGLQQISELLPIPGLAMLGPLPEPVQRSTIFAAALTARAAEPEAAAALVAFFRSPAAAPVIRATGLDPA